MRLPSFKLMAIMAGLLVFAVGGLWVWFGDGKPPATPPPGSPSLAAAENTAGGSAIESQPAAPRSSRAANQDGTGPHETAANPPPLENTADPVSAPAQWEKTIDDILIGEGDESQKSQKLLELLPTLPEEAQIEAAQHIVNLVPDEGYAATSQYLTNAQTSEAVLDVLVGDLMNRPNTLKLPLLLQVARVPEHPKAGEARELLEFYVGEDLGTDWDAWEKSVTTWLKDNPE